MMGWLHDRTGGFGTGLVVLGAVALAGGLVALTLRTGTEARAEDLAPGAQAAE